MEKGKRYLVFLIGLFVNAFSISLITKANLGTSPISSVPYTLSLYFPYTLGQFTIAFSVLLILLQILLLREKFEKIQLLQIPVSVLFGYFIDMTMQMLFFLDPQTYPGQIISLLIGCVVLGFGVYLEVLANVVMLPGEGFVKAVCIAFHRDFGKTKVCFDATMCVSAVAISLILFHRLEGVREGTVLSALLVGTFAGFFQRKLSFVPSLLFSDEIQSQQLIPVDQAGLVVTIAREYGSGGHEIGERLARRLGIRFYDKELIEMAAKETGFSVDFVEKNEQSLRNPLRRELLSQFYVYSKEDMPPEDKLFLAEWKVISEIAAQGNCVIVGRCADAILQDRPNTIRLFIHAPENFRRIHAMQQYGLTAEQAEQQVRTVSEERARHYKRYTGGIWGSAARYHVAIDSSVYGIDGCVDLLYEAVKAAQNRSSDLF